MEEQYQDDNVGRAMQDTGKKAARAAGKAGLWAGKKIIKLTIITGGGCLIPLLLVVFIIIVSGLISSITLSKKYNYDEIAAKAGEGVSSQEALFDQMYMDIMLGGGFSSSELNAMAFDMVSLKRMFSLIQAYNSGELKKNIKVEFKGTYSVFNQTGTAYYQWIDNELVELTEERYKELQESYLAGDTGLVVWESSVGETQYYDTSTTSEVILDNTWLREKYQIPWQIVYMLCYYDSVENGNSSTELDPDGKKIRLQSSYIEKIIEDVAAEEIADIGPEYIFEEYNANGKKHALNAIAYPWGKYMVTQDDVKAYGAYISGTSFYESVYCSEAGSYQSVYFSGSIPVSRIKQVQTLTQIDIYNSVNGEQTEADLKETIYTVDKLEALLDKYGNGRDINMLMFALKELPGGADIVAEIEYAMEQQKKAEEVEGGA